MIFHLVAAIIMFITANTDVWGEVNGPNAALFNALGFFFLGFAWSPIAFGLPSVGSRKE